MESIIVFKILLGVCLVLIPSSLLGYPLLGAFGKARYANFTVIIASIFHIVLLMFLLIFNSITVYTVASLVLVTELLVLVLRIRGVKKYINI